MCECVGQRNVWLRRPEVYIHRWQGNGLCIWFLPKQWQKRLAFTSFGISYMLLKIKLRSVTSSKSSGKGTPSYCPSMKETNGLVKTKRVNSGMSKIGSQTGKAWQKKPLLVVLPLFIPILAAATSMQPIWPLVHSASTELATHTLLSRKWNQNEQPSGHLRDRCKGWPLSIPSESVLRADVAFQVSFAKSVEGTRTDPWRQVTTLKMSTRQDVTRNLNSEKGYKWLKKVALLNIFCDQNVETSVLY